MQSWNRALKQYESHNDCNNGTESVTIPDTSPPKKEPAVTAPVATVKAKAKRPKLTEANIPTMGKYYMGGNTSCIICLKGNLSMYAMRNHVESKHYVKVGDPLSAWIKAGERWDRQQGILPEVSPEQEPARASSVMEDVQPSVSTPSTSADTVKLMAAGKVLEAKVSELAASHSQLQASCAATLSKNYSTMWI